MLCWSSGFLPTSGPRAVVSSCFPATRTGLASTCWRRFPPVIPGDLEQLAKLTADPEAGKWARSFQRYANSKLAITSWMYALNRHLQAVSVVVYFV